MRSAYPLALAAVIAVSGCGAVARGASPDRGRIEPHHSIDRLRIGMSPAEVRARYGSPDKVKRFSESETGKPILDWVYRDRKVVATMRRVNGGRFSLAGISTTSTRHRTAGGSGVGSSEAQVRRAEDGVRCQRWDAKERWCTLESGNRQTTFVLRESRRITEVRMLITW